MMVISSRRNSMLATPTPTATNNEKCDKSSNGPGHSCQWNQDKVGCNSLSNNHNDKNSNKNNDCDNDKDNNNVQRQ